MWALPGSDLPWTFPGFIASKGWDFGWVKTSGVGAPRWVIEGVLSFNFLVVPSWAFEVRLVCGSVALVLSDFGCDKGA